MTPILTDHNAAAAFKKFLSCREHHDLPWETQEKEMQEIFYAGWAAKEDSLKQGLLPLGTNAHLEPKSSNRDDFSVQPVSIKAENVVTAEMIYDAYPRKVGRQDAIKAIKKTMKDRAHMGANPIWLMERTQAFAAATKSWPTADRQFIPHPSTWFNRGSYDDDPKEWVRGYAATTSQFSKQYP